MAIIVTCQCGKQLRAKDEHAGMQATCPACRQRIAIPGVVLNTNQPGPPAFDSSPSLPPGMPPLPDCSPASAHQSVGTRKLFVLAILTIILGIYVFSWLFGPKSISAEHLWSDWQNDQNAFLSKYGGKTLVVTGQAVGFERDQYGLPDEKVTGVGLYGGGLPFMACFFEKPLPTSEFRLSEFPLSKDYKVPLEIFVTIKGKCRENVAGEHIYIDDCTLLSIRFNATGPYTTETLEAIENVKVIGSQNRLIQIGFAMDNYHDVYRHFPAASTYSSDGKPLLSWRVVILPYMEHTQLFNQFHLDEPWDSPHNKTLIDKMPAEYRSPESKLKEPKTNYVVPVGPGTAFEGRKGMSIGNITDGAAHTVMAVEVDDAHAVIWTKPDDHPYNPNEPAKGLGGLYKNIVNAVFCDGRVHSFKSSMPDNKLRAMFSANGRDPAPDFYGNGAAEKRLSVPKEAPAEPAE